MSKELIKDLKLQRGVVKGQLTRFITFIENETNHIKIDEINERLQRLEGLWQEFQKVQLQIEIIDSSKTETTERESFEDTYFKYAALGRSVIHHYNEQIQLHNEKHTIPNLAKDNMSISIPNINVKLPQIDLPNFYGNYEGWLPFYEGFKALVLDNPSINNIQRFYYLLSCLKNDSIQVIQSLEVSDENFDVAWQLLRDRYENKRIIIHSHVKGIFELPTMNKENHVTLRKVIDTFLKHHRALKTLGEPVDTWETLLIYLLNSKLDHHTKREWEGSIKYNKLPDLKTFLEFLKNKAQLLETLDTRDSMKSNSFSKEKYTSKSFSHLVTDFQETNDIICSFCKDTHLTFKCSKLLSFSPKSRYIELKKRKICSNCLKAGHLVETCRSNKVCKICKKRHNTALHSNNISLNNELSLLQNKKPQQPNTTVPVTQQIHTETDLEPQYSIENDSNNNKEHSNHSHITTTLLSNSNNTTQILLPTVEVYVYDLNNKPVKVRALLDSASQSNFITKELLSKLKLPISKVHMPVTSINQAALYIHETTQAYITSIDHTYSVQLSFLVINEITGNLPQFSFSPSYLNIPSHIQLSDTSFHKPGKVDMLLGASIFFTLITSQRIELGENNPIIQHTKLGWIIAGPLEIYEHKHKYTNNFSSKNNSHCLFIQNSNDINEQLERFWQIEHLHSSHSKLSNEELECESYFRKHFYQDHTGRCTVKLPLRENYNNLGDSLPTALKRLRSIEFKLSRNENLRQQYHDFLQEYEDLGHMTKVDINHDSSYEIYNYLPHHAIVRDSITSRVRVVFDASSKTSSGLSLNDVLKIGPKIQDDLFGIVLRMRTFNIVITADITKMYRQINVDKSQRNLQRIIWRKNPGDAINHYTLNTVTYGTSSASFLATRTLHQIGLNAKEIDPIASDVILNNFYMDDLICGASDLEEARKLKFSIENILLSAGLPLRKWLSNNPAMFDKEHNKDESHYIISSNKDVKTLGIVWNPEADVFRYSVQFSNLDQPITKRLILSNIATIFDPLGLIGPCIVIMKLLLQQLWQLKIEWDDSVPVTIRDKWLHFIDNSHHINTICIPRHMIYSNHSSISLHGFSDSSEVAFGCCIYLVSTDLHSNIYSHLVCAKSRLAPLKVVTLPRLELCGALLLAQLMHKVKTYLKLEINNTYLWTDSTIVLSWLDSQPNKWKTFVSNRVAEIQNLSENSTWRYVNTCDNPADVISRGLNPENLMQCYIWWHGPHWLKYSSENWPQEKIVNIDIIPEERKGKINLTYHVMLDTSIFSRFSNFSKLQRITSYILRFIHNAKGKNKITGQLTYNELSSATLVLCKIVQSNEFPSELKLLTEGKSINKNSKLISLYPFIDSEGIIRVGGRLKNANIPFNQKHQIVLPGKHIFTRLLIKHEHHKYLHAGPQLILSRLRTQFWPINGRNSVRSALKNCLTCFKAKPTELYQVMGNLPEKRVTPSRAFTYCGVDYAGFYNIKDGKLRTRTFIKCYLCIFVCLATKAVHIELVTDLTSDGFMNAFKRFVSRRGLCRRLYTDNATNFQGASNNLKKIHEILVNTPQNPKFATYFSENNIEWHFIPPRSPHFGGIWEAAVKSFKYHIKRIVMDCSLTFEDFYTILTQIEAILNSRPLLPLSSDTQDLQFLTPGHFLIGDALVSVPQDNVVDIAENRLSAYKRLQRLTQRFWKIWSNDYLNTLQQRSKWRQDASNISVGSLVLLKEENLPPMNWQVARVLQVHPGQDNKVRVVTVKTSNGVFKRAIHRVCPIPETDNEAS